MNRIAGKLILITGASSGIGEACARRFAAEGANLVLWARRKDRLERVGAELEGRHGVTVQRAELDVRDRAVVNRVAAELVAAGHVPDILINNAGLASGLAKIHEGDPEDWDRMIDTNLKGLLYVSRAIMPHMVARRRGHVGPRVGSGPGVRRNGVLRGPLPRRQGACRGGVPGVQAAVGGGRGGRDRLRGEPARAREHPRPDHRADCAAQRVRRGSRAMKTRLLLVLATLPQASSLHVLHAMADGQAQTIVVLDSIPGLVTWRLVPNRNQPPAPPRRTVARSHRQAPRS